MSTGQEVNASDPAFAVPAAPYSPGLTKREYIATMALQGILANVRGYDDTTYKGAARDAVLHADTLLEQLAKPVATFTGDDDE
jgi:hypothetical protein